ncbi:MAG: UbiX family flavin prenyltransferase [Alphaproteobacteria bacterium]|nr:UbiX family flavin prenyltransferase [Alphaproteobacteria bacterium]
MTKPRIIVGISGASGAVYGVECLRALKAAGVETHLVISKTAGITIAHETDLSVADVQKLADVNHSHMDLSASIASGSFKTAGMIVAPCSMRSLAEIAHGASTNLLTRAADVILKERRKLVLLVRETPLNNAHLKNMLAVSEMGGIIAPPVPAFYSKPKTLDEMVRHTVGRTLDIFDFPHDLVARWEGVPAK